MRGLPAIALVLVLITGFAGCSSDRPEVSDHPLQPYRNLAADSLRLTPFVQFHNQVPPRITPDWVPSIDDAWIAFGELQAMDQWNTDTSFVEFDPIYRPFNVISKTALYRVTEARELVDSLTAYPAANLRFLRAKLDALSSFDTRAIRDTMRYYARSNDPELQNLAMYYVGTVCQDTAFLVEIATRRMDYRWLTLLGAELPDSAYRAEAIAHPEDFAKYGSPLSTPRGIYRRHAYSGAFSYPPRADDDLPPFTNDTTLLHDLCINSLEYYRTHGNDGLSTRNARWRQLINLLDTVSRGNMVDVLPHTEYLLRDQERVAERAAFTITHMEGKGHQEATDILDRALTDPDVSDQVKKIIRNSRERRERNQAEHEERQNQPDQEGNW